RLALLVAEATDSVSAPATASAADVGVLGVVTELGDAAHDDGVNSQQLAQLGRRGGVRSVTVREILFGQNLVHSFAIDHRVGAVLHQILHSEIGNALAY